MYRLSARQILVIALLSAIFAASGVILVEQVSRRWFQKTIAFTETTPPGIADPATVTDERNNIEVYKTISPGVVFITSTSVSYDFFEVTPRQGTGSGSIIDNQGHILTNYHVVEGAQKLTVSLGGNKVYPAVHVGSDPNTDLAVIKINVPREHLTIVPFGDSNKLVVGQKVLAIGNPFGLDRTLTTGVISGLERPIRARNGLPIEGAIQTDASINPGNSGGPLLDSHGRMIGINTQILSPAGGSVGVGFAVPINIAKRIVPQLIRNGVVIRPTLGISTINVSDISARLPVEEGLVIRQVAPNGAAATAGLRGLGQTEDGEFVLGDIIVAINGEKVKDKDDLYKILDRHQVGDTIQVQVFRDNGLATVPVRLVAEKRGLFRK
jgi:S1-C subfamily serine protease